eukprot:jgi/Mesvir1/296/Mv13623-RA.2
MRSSMLARLRAEQNAWVNDLASLAGGTSQSRTTTHELKSSGPDIARAENAAAAPPPESLSEARKGFSAPRENQDLEANRNSRPAGHSGPTSNGEGGFQSDGPCSGAESAPEEEMRNTRSKEARIVKLEEKCAASRRALAAQTRLLCALQEALRQRDAEAAVLQREAALAHQERSKALTQLAELASTSHTRGCGASASQGGVATSCGHCQQPLAASLPDIAATSTSSPNPALMARTSVGGSAVAEAHAAPTQPGAPGPAGGADPCKGAGMASAATGSGSDQGGGDQAALSCPSCAEMRDVVQTALAEAGAFRDRCQQRMHRELETLQAEFASAWQGATEQIGALQAKEKELQVALEDATSKLERQREENAQWETRLSQHRAAEEQAKGEAGAWQTTATKMEARLLAARAEMEGLRQALADAERRCDVAVAAEKEKVEAAARVKLDALQQVADKAHDVVREMQRRLDTAAEDQLVLQARLNAAREEVRTIQESTALLLEAHTHASTQKAQEGPSSPVLSSTPAFASIATSPLRLPAGRPAELVSDNSLPHSHVDRETPVTLSRTCAHCGTDSSDTFGTALGTRLDFTSSSSSSSVDGGLRVGSPPDSVTDGAKLRAENPYHVKADARWLPSGPGGSTQHRAGESGGRSDVDLANGNKDVAGDVMAGNGTVDAGGNSSEAVEASSHGGAGTALRTRHAADAEATDGDAADGASTRMYGDAATGAVAVKTAAKGAAGATTATATKGAAAAVTAAAVAAAAAANSAASAEEVDARAAAAAATAEGEAIAAAAAAQAATAVAAALSARFAKEISLLKAVVCEKDAEILDLSAELEVLQERARVLQEQARVCEREHNDAADAIASSVLLHRILVQLHGRLRAHADAVSGGEQHPLNDVAAHPLGRMGGGAAVAGMARAEVAHDSNSRLHHDFSGQFDDNAGPLALDMMATGAGLYGNNTAAQGQHSYLHRYNHQQQEQQQEIQDGQEQQEQLPPHPILAHRALALQAGVEEMAACLSARVQALRRQLIMAHSGGGGSSSGGGGASLSTASPLATSTYLPSPLPVEVTWPLSSASSTTAASMPSVVAREGPMDPSHHVLGTSRESMRERMREGMREGVLGVATANSPGAIGALVSQRHSLETNNSAGGAATGTAGVSLSEPRRMHGDGTTATRPLVTVAATTALPSARAENVGRSEGPALTTTGPSLVPDAVQGNDWDCRATGAPSEEPGLDALATLRYELDDLSVCLHQAVLMCELELSEGGADNGPSTLAGGDAAGEDGVGGGVPSGGVVKGGVTGDGIESGDISTPRWALDRDGNGSAARALEEGAAVGGRIGHADGDDGSGRYRGVGHRAYASSLARPGGAGAHLPACPRPNAETASGVTSGGLVGTAAPTAGPIDTKANYNGKANDDGERRRQRRGLVTDALDRLHRLCQVSRSLRVQLARRGNALTEAEARAEELKRRAQELKDSHADELRGLEGVIERLKLEQEDELAGLRKWHAEEVADLRRRLGDAEAGMAAGAERWRAVEAELVSMRVASVLAGITELADEGEQEGEGEECDSTGMETTQGPGDDSLSTGLRLSYVPSSMMAIWAVGTGGLGNGDVVEVAAGDEQQRGMPGLRDASLGVRELRSSASISLDAHGTRGGDVRKSLHDSMRVIGSARRSVAVMTDHAWVSPATLDAAIKGMGRVRTFFARTRVHGTSLLQQVLALDLCVRQLELLGQDASMPVPTMEARWADQDASMAAAPEGGSYPTRESSSRGGTMGASDTPRGVSTSGPFRAVPDEEECW